LTVDLLAHTTDDGPKWTCLEEMNAYKNACLIYSLGIGPQLAWDVAMRQR
jgi:hypothetical protein